MTLSEKIQELNLKLSTMLEQRKLLNEELKEWAGKRDRLNAEHRCIKNEAVTLKNLRDDCNLRVRNLKEDLQALQTLLREKCLNSNVLREEASPLRNQLQKENIAFRKIRELEWKIQTATMSLEEEKRIVHQIQTSEKQLKIHREVESINKKLSGLAAEIVNIRDRISQIREERRRLSEKIGEYHQKMLEKFEQAAKIKASADQVHAKFCGCKEKVANTEQMCSEILTQINEVERDLEKALLRDHVSKVRKANEELTASAKIKLEKKKRMTIDELKMLIRKGLIQID